MLRARCNKSFGTKDTAPTAVLEIFLQRGFCRRIPVPLTAGKYWSTELKERMANKYQPPPIFEAASHPASVSIGGLEHGSNHWGG
ncbi:hypothetical protein MCOR30_002855 [Pyricularia oryzae]|nr:hypothetical protein MCOR30_002855 [Pyricularia oryzae]